MLGLSKEELIELGYFGKTEEEGINKLFGTSNDFGLVVRTMTSAIRDKTIELILANNEQITEQLKDAGIKFPT